MFALVSSLVKIIKGDLYVCSSIFPVKLIKGDLCLH